MWSNGREHKERKRKEDTQQCARRKRGRKTPLCAPCERPPPPTTARPNCSAGTCAHRERKETGQKEANSVLPSLFSLSVFTQCAQSRSPFPPPPLRSTGGMSDSRMAELLPPRLQQLTPAQDSIQGLRMWLLHHRKDAAAAVAVWRDELRKGGRAHRQRLLHA